MLVMTWELFIEAWVMLVLCTRKGLCGCKPEQGKHCNIQDVGESDFTNATCSQENDIHSITMENQSKTLHIIYSHVIPKNILFCLLFFIWKIVEFAL